MNDAGRRRVCGGSSRLPAARSRPAQDQSCYRFLLPALAAAATAAGGAGAGAAGEVGAAAAVEGMASETGAAALLLPLQRNCHTRGRPLMPTVGATDEVAKEGRLERA